MRIDLNEQIKVSMFGKVRQKTGYWHPGRSISQNLLLVLAKGNLNIQIAGQTFAAGEGDALLIPAGTHYIPLETDGCIYYFFHFTAFSAAKQNQKVEISENKELSPGNYAYSYENDTTSYVEIDPYMPHGGLYSGIRLCEKAATLNPYRNICEKLLMDTVLRELLIELYANRFAASPRRLFLHRISSYLEQHYRETITLSVLSEQFGLSKSYIARLFRTEMKMPSSAFLNRTRIAAACKLLVRTDSPIGEIARETGFENAYYFSRVFREIKGISPSDFRNRSIGMHP